VDDFCRRVDLRQINRRMLECLIKVGALDRFGTRAQLLGIVDQMMSVSGQVHQAAEVGQLTMFDMFGAGAQSAPGSLVLPEVPPLSPRERLNWEKELVGFYLSEHPLNQVAVDLRDTVTCFCGEVGEDMHGQPVTLAGVVQWVRPHVTRRGDPMAFVHLEDIQGGIELVVFPRTYEATRHLWVQDKVLVVRGKVDAERGEPKVLVDSAQDYLVVARPVDEEQAALAVSPPDAGAEAHGGVSLVRELRATDYEPAPAGPQVQPAAVEPAAEPSAPAPQRQGPRGNGGPGGNGQGHAPRQREPSPAPDERAVSRHVQITLQRTGDQQHDRQRVQRIYDMLQVQHGQDHFTFIVVSGQSRVEIDFPNATTAFTPDLARSLRAMLGQDAVRVV
jgi:DNA polymerase-3 subunit alpha